MAYAYGRLFLPVVNLCSAGSAYGYQDLAAVDPSRGTGALVALDARTGRRVWVRKLPLPDFGCATVGNGVVFTSTFDGTVYALDAGTGAILWKTTLRGGVNACPALTSNRLLVPAGIAHGRGGVTELVAFEP
jgi:glucose dehydrogenase